jgi:hypothetical protein
MLSTLILIFAGLLLRAQTQVRLIDPGVSGNATKIAVLALRTEKYGARDKRQAFFDTVMARLSHVPGIRVDDSGSALPLAGNRYYAVFFSIGGEAPAAQLPDGQQFIRWRADVGPEPLAQEVNRVVKTFDRGIHYWHVGSDGPMGNVTAAVFSVYGVLALLFVYLGFRGDTSGYSLLAVAVGILAGLGLAKATTFLLTGYLFGVGLADLPTFLVSAGIAAGTVLFALKR